VGSYLDSAGVWRTLAESWDGSNWSLQSTPVPAGASYSSFLRVSCATSTACVAVGNYANDAGTPRALAERWDGANWTIDPTPDPAGATGSALGGVSCPTTVDCTAVGYYRNSTGILPLAEARSSSGWVIKAAPPPAGSGFAVLNAVSCSAVTACSAVGSSRSSPAPGTTTGFAERWDGSTWTVQTMASPSTADSVNLSSISCASSANCTAVGYYSGSTSERSTLAEGWDGTTWTIQPSPNPPGMQGSEFSAVSCVTTTNCTAVGWSFSTGAIVALAERYSGPSTPTSLTAAPQLVIFPPPAGVGLGTVSAKLTSSRSTPLAGRTVRFTSAGIPLCTGVTSATGTATCHLGFLEELIVLLANRYSASFAGDATYQPSSASTPAITLFGFAAQARAARRAAHRRVRIISGAITRGHLRYAVLVKRRSHGVTRLRFKALRRIRRGRYTLTLKLTGGIQVRRTIALR
jgi:hypothetical protein